MAEFWQGTLAGACVATAVSGGGNGLYFGLLAASTRLPARRVGARPLAAVNTAVALHATLQAVSLVNGEPVSLGAALLVQMLAGAGAVGTSAVILRRRLQGNGGAL
jgi:hypothetical protein